MGLGTPQPGRLGDQLPTLVGLCFRAHGSAGGHNRAWARWAPSAGCGSQAALNALTTDGRKQDHVTGHAHQWKTRLGPGVGANLPSPCPRHSPACCAQGDGCWAEGFPQGLRPPAPGQSTCTEDSDTKPGTHSLGWDKNRMAGGGRLTDPSPRLGPSRKAGVTPQGCTDSVRNGQAPHGLQARCKIKS